MKIPRGQTEERKIYMKQYRATHPKKDRSEYKRNYDDEHEHQIKQYRETKKDEIKSQRAEHYKKNRDAILAKVKYFYIQNKEKLISYQKEYNIKNKDKIRKRELEYNRTNSQRVSHIANRRRTRKVNNGGSHTLDELVQKFSSLGNVCFYCGIGGKLTIDHDIPLSRGGTNNIDNILPACKSCNSRKRTLTAHEFIHKIKTKLCYTLSQLY